MSEDQTPKGGRKREPEIPVAPVNLDSRAQALSKLLPKKFAEFDVEIGSTTDEVTLRILPKDIVQICVKAREDPELSLNYLRCLSVVDYSERLDVNYHLFSMETR